MPYPFIKLSLHRYVIAESALQKVRKTIDQLVGIDSLRCQGLLASERHEAGSQRSGPLSAFLGNTDVLRDARVVLSFCPHLRKVECSNDDGQHIVEVVRDASGKLTYGFHLLHLAYLSLRRNAVRHLRLKLSRS